MSHPPRKFVGMNNQSTPTTKSMPKWLKIVLIVFGAFVALAGLMAILNPQSETSSTSSDGVRADAEAEIANGSTTSTNAPATEAPPPEQTSTTTEPPAQVTAVDLYQEREANATRFDDNRKGTRVTVTGTVGEIDDGDVRLVVDEEAWEFGWLLNHIALQDLPREQQAAANKGETFTATCVVGNYVFGTMYLKECSTTTEAPAATSAPTATEAPATKTEADTEVTAVALYQEREANATRFDDNRKGTRVTVTGTVGEIEDGDVRLVVDEEEWELFEALFLNYIALQDLPRERQVAANKGESFTATCVVDDYVFGTMYLKECS